MMGDFNGDLIIPRENNVWKVFVETCFSSTSNNENLPDILRPNMKLTKTAKLINSPSLLHVSNDSREPVISLLQKVGKRFVVK